MHAADVMTKTVVTVGPEAGVAEVAGLLLNHHISAVPVVDGEGRMLGIVSEGDLMRRAENDTEGRGAWWLEALFSTKDLAKDYVKTHGRTAGDVMTRFVVTVEEATPLHEIAALLEKHHIKRVPVLRDGRLVGIVSRANLLHGLVSKPAAASGPVEASDKTIRETLLKTLSQKAGVHASMINVTVSDGVVQLWGLVDSGTEIKAAGVAAENTPGVTAVENHLGKVPAGMGV